MRKLVLGCGLLAGAIALLAQNPATKVRAQDSAGPGTRSSRAPQAKPAEHRASAASKVDSAKEAQIRELMEATGVNGLGEQLMKEGIAQLRANITEAQPDNPRAKQFADAFAAKFQKHFDPRSVTESVIPIYDKYLTAEDLKMLLDYYKSPFGQRMLKILPEVARDSQMAGYSLGQKAAEDTMDELRGEFPEFAPSPNPKEDEKHPDAGQQR